MDEFQEQMATLRAEAASLAASDPAQSEVILERVGKFEAHYSPDKGFIGQSESTAGLTNWTISTKFSFCRLYDYVQAASATGVEVKPSTGRDASRLNNIGLRFQNMSIGSMKSRGAKFKQIDEAYQELGADQFVDVVQDNPERVLKLFQEAEENGLIRPGMTANLEKFFRHALGVEKPLSEMTHDELENVKTGLSKMTSKQKDHLKGIGLYFFTHLNDSAMRV
ncbi:MAG: hypothetical protein ACI9BD_000289, partial [Candidatus Marinamargulisbacteria bacterium]